MISDISIAANYRTFLLRFDSRALQVRVRVRYDKSTGILAI